MSTVTITKPDQHVQSDTDPGWKVMLHNDDVTPIDVVVLALQHAAGVSLEVAEMIAREANDHDLAVVKRGLSRVTAEQIVSRLVVLTTIPRLCPGVCAEAVRDDA